MKQASNIQNWVISIIVYLIVFTKIHAQTPTTDLTAHAPTTPQPLGTIFEWHNALPISDINVVSNPTSVTSGLYYAVYKYSNTCYSQPSPIRVVANNCPQNTINLNDFVIGTNLPTNLTISFHNSLPVSATNKLTGSNITAVGAGTYYAAYFDVTNNCYSNPNPIIVLNSDCCTPPLANDNEICGAGQVTLNATCLLGNVNWYDSNVASISIAAGNTFTTPNIIQSTIYYISCKNGLCESIKKPVLAIIKELPKTEGIAISPTCLGTVNIGNGQIIATKFVDSDKYSINEGTSYNSLTATFPTTIPTDGILKNNISANPSQTFSIRFTNINGCYKDQTIILSNLCPQCSENSCLSPLITKTK
jgi:hypothetical protein